MHRPEKYLGFSLKIQDFPHFSTKKKKYNVTRREKD
jgi:hypothetical protein